MKGLLRQLIERLDRVIELLDRGDLPEHPHIPAYPDAYPAGQGRPYVPPIPRTEPPRHCTKCGINLTGAVLYVCGDVTCPSGLGPTTMS